MNDPSWNGPWAAALQVRVISLTPATKILQTMRRLLPGADVGVQTAVDVRNVSVRVLHRTGTISHSTEHALRHGRRWDHEVGTRGAVGLAHAVRLALENDRTRPLLLLEEDCLIVDEARFQDECRRLLRNTMLWDMAFFGTFGPAASECVRAATFMDDDGPADRRGGKGWHFVDDGMFWGLHCGIYLPRARTYVAARLREPLEMQIDSLYSKMSARGDMRIVVQTRHASAEQASHVSTVQSPFGVLGANILRHTQAVKSTQVILVSVAISVAIAWGCIRWRTTRK